MEWQYFVGNCSDPAVQEEAKKNFQKAVNFVFGSGDDQWCQTQNACSLDNIVVACGKVQRRRRRSAEVSRPW